MAVTRSQGAASKKPTKETKRGKATTTTTTTKPSSCGCSLYRSGTTSRAYGASAKANSAREGKARLTYRSTSALPRESPRYRAAVLSAMKNASASVASKAVGMAADAGDKLLEKGYAYASGQTHKDCVDEANTFFKEAIKNDKQFCDWDRAKKFGIVMAAGLRAGIVFLALYEAGIAQTLYSFIQTDFYGWLKWIVQKSVEYTFGLCGSSAIGRGGLSNSFLGYIPFVKTVAYTGDLLVCGVVVGGLTLALETTVAKAVKSIIEGIVKSGEWTVRNVHKLMNGIPYLRPVYLAHIARRMTLPDASPEEQKEYNILASGTDKPSQTNTRKQAPPLLLTYQPLMTDEKRNGRSQTSTARSSRKRVVQNST